MAVGLIMIAGGIAAGIFGSLLGLGGGVLIVPLLTFGFDLPIREAVAVSLVCVIVTSSASAGVYLQRQVANLRLGMTLELFTALGALAGGLIAFSLSDRLLAALFAVAARLRRDHDAPTARATEGQGRGRGRGRTADAAGRAARRGLRGVGGRGAADGLGRGRRSRGPRAAGGRRPGATPAATPVAPPSLIDRLSQPDYRIRNLGRGVIGSVGAGVISALLGVGGGIIKVPLMNLLMGVPLRVATATSNLMIGVTASASAIVYLLRGGIDPLVAGPTAVGVFVGASIGSRIAHRVDVRVLRMLFVVVLLYTAFQMLMRALGPA